MSELDERYPESQENLSILKKIIENSYQRKQLKETIERVFEKALKMLNSESDSKEFEDLKREFGELRSCINIS